MKFEDIKKESDIVSFLNDVNRRLSRKEFIYHYTTIDRCISIFKSKLWYLSQARCMNDQLEYNNGDRHKWNNLFFASFMSEVEESIGMWSMYAQPWEDGVKIALPINKVKTWVNSISVIKEISCTDFKTTGRYVQCDEKSKIYISSVAYTNFDSKITDKNELSWNTVTNANFPNASRNKLLTGYVKDFAWEYEKEVRIKAEFDNIFNFSKVAVDIPDYIFNSMIITAGPLFKGDLQKRLKNEIERSFTVNTSLFKNRFNLKSNCNDCEIKKAELI